MSKITQVQLQGIHYYWDGQHILVSNGLGDPWVISGSRLEQIELEQIVQEEEHAEPSSALFSIDFLTQQWSLLNAAPTTDIKLLDEQGEECAWPLLTIDAQLLRLSADTDSVTLPFLAQILIPSVLFEEQILDSTAFEFSPGRSPSLADAPALLTRATALSVEDMLQDAESLLVPLNASAIDTLGLNTAAVDDVLNWLAMYSHYDQ